MTRESNIIGNRIDFRPGSGGTEGICCIMGLTTSFWLILISPTNQEPMNQRGPSANPHQFRKINLSYSRFFLRPVTKNATNTEVANKKGSNPGKPLEPLDPDEVFPDELLPEFA